MCKVKAVFLLAFVKIEAIYSLKLAVMDTVSYIINSPPSATPQLRLMMERARIVDMLSKFKLQIAVTHLVTSLEWNVTNVTFSWDFSHILKDHTVNSLYQRLRSEDLVERVSKDQKQKFYRVAPLKISKRLCRSPISVRLQMFAL